MFKGLVVSAVVVIGLGALADRGLAVVAGEAAGASVARSQGLEDEPDVSFRGFPFLTQALRGRFTEVDVDARDVQVEGLTFSRIEAELRGLEVGLSDALAGEVEAVPVDSGLATVTMDYSDLNAFLDRLPGSPKVSSTGGVLEVRSTVGVPGRGSVPVVGRGTATIGASGIVVRVSGVRAADGGTLPAAAASAAATRLSFTIPTRGLPFGITVRRVAVEDDALLLAADAQGVVVRVR